MELNEQQQHIMKHAWGFGHKEPGFRSHYCTEVGHHEMQKLVVMGIFHGPHDVGHVGEGLGMFYLTERGKGLLYEMKKQEEEELCAQDPRYAERIKENLWDENFQEVTDFIKEASAERMEGWQWIKNSRCKYVQLRIDMRDGGFIIQDRHGKRISLDQLKYQYKRGDD